MLIILLSIGVGLASRIAPHPIIAHHRGSSPFVFNVLGGTRAQQQLPYTLVAQPVVTFNIFESDTGYQSQWRMRMTKGWL